MLIFKGFLVHSVLTHLSNHLNYYPSIVKRKPAIFTLWIRELSFFDWLTCITLPSFSTMFCLYYHVLRKRVYFCSTSSKVGSDTWGTFESFNTLLWALSEVRRICCSLTKWQIRNLPLLYKGTCLYTINCYNYSSHSKRV